MAYSIAKSLFKNTATMMVAQLVTWVCGLVVFIFIPRFLGSAAYGRVYLALSIQMILFIVIDYGGNFLITKDISRNRDGASEIMSHAVILRLMLWVLSVGLAYLICVLAHYPKSVTILVMVLAVANAWTNMTSLLRYCFLGFEDIKYPSIGAVAERSFMMISVVIALLLGAREEAVVILIAVSGLFSFGISALYSRKMFRLNLSLHLKTLGRLLKIGLPYFLWATFGIIYFRVDAVLLSLMTPDSVVGWYGAAYRFFDVLMFLPSIFAQALYPIVARLSTHETDSMVYTSRRSIEFLFLASVPISVGMIMFAEPVIGLLLGLPAFAPSIPVLQLLSVGTILVYVDFVLGNTVIALDKEKTWAFVGFGAMVVNIGLNLFMIKYFQTRYSNGGIGAAIATDLTELFIMICAASMLPKRLFGGGFGTVIIKGITSGAIMALLIVLGNHVNIPWLVSAVTSVIAYIGILILLGTFEPKEMGLIFNTISAKNIKRIIMARREAGA